MADNVIKLKPPMAFTVDDAARVVRELDDVMTLMARDDVA